MVEWIRLGVDTALRSAMRAEHVADEYDVRRSHRSLPPQRVTLSFVDRATRAAALADRVGDLVGAVCVCDLQRRLVGQNV